MAQIVSVFMLVLMCCVSVFQCHHHDAAGHAFFMTHGEMEIAMSGNHEDCHHHDCGGAHNDETSVCGMHLTDALAKIRVQSIVVDVNFLICDLVDCVSQLSEPELSVENISRARVAIGRETKVYFHNNSTRGSPTSV